MTDVISQRFVTDKTWMSDGYLDNLITYLIVIENYKILLTNAQNVITCYV